MSLLRQARGRDLEFINRMSQRYVGAPYFRRSEREVFYIIHDHVRTSQGRRR